MNFIIMLFTAVSASAAKWECKASCNIQLITAKRDATQKTPRGTYARHCQCKYSKK